MNLPNATLNSTWFTWDKSRKNKKKKKKTPDTCRRSGQGTKGSSSGSNRKKTFRDELIAFVTFAFAFPVFTGRVYRYTWPQTAKSLSYFAKTTVIILSEVPLSIVDNRVVCCWFFFLIRGLYFCEGSRSCGISLETHIQTHVTRVVLFAKR